MKFNLSKFFNIDFSKYLKCKSEYSSMRLSLINCVIVATYGGFILAVLDVVLNKSQGLFGVAAFVTAILGPVILGKQAQNKSELNKGKEDKNES
jgi:hypothetical protein